MQATFQQLARRMPSMCFMSNSVHHRAVRTAQKKKSTAVARLWDLVCQVMEYAYRPRRRMRNALATMRLMCVLVDKAFFCRDHDDVVRLIAHVRRVFPRLAAAFGDDEMCAPTFKVRGVPGRRG